MCDASEIVEYDRRRSACLSNTHLSIGNMTTMEQSPYLVSK